MNTFQLSCFLAVAENLSFARAAEQLNVTQPAVTHQIHSLEEELNVKLLKRTTRTVEITTAGYAFLGDARNMLAISMRAKKRFETPLGSEPQPFAIGCHSDTHLFLLPEVLRRLTEQFPHLHPLLRTVPFQHLYRLLEEEEVDVIIGFREPDSRKTPGVYRELQKSPIVCLCSADNPLAAEGSVDFERLRAERLVLNAPVAAPSAIAQLQGILMEGRPFSELYFCQSAEAVVVLVQAGMGIALLPELLIPPSLPLARLPITGVGAISFGLYYKSLQGNTPLRSFLHIMQEEMRRPPQRETPQNTAPLR